MSDRKRYPGDLTDGRWALIEPVLTAWKAGHPSASGHQGGYELREIVNAILYQSRTGCQREYLPRDLPPRSAAYCCFARWRDDGTGQTIHDLRRWHAREKKGRKAGPGLVVPGTQSVRAAAPVPAETTGKDPGKKVPGRKRGLAVDVLGLVIAVVVLAVSAHENTAGTALPDQVAASTPAVSTALAGQGFKNSVAAHGAAAGIDVQAAGRNPAGKGLVPQARRRVAGQAFGILSLPPAPGPRLRAQPGQLRVQGVPGDDRRDGPAAGRHLRALVAGRVTAVPDPGRHLLDRTDAREQALAREAAGVQARTGELTARLRDLGQEISDLQVTRKTLLSLADQDA